MTVAERVGEELGALGVAHAFGVVGSGNLHVTNALRAAGVPYVAARHEGGAATMADAYARTSDRVAVLSVHQGPGLTNAITGIAEAAKSRTPLLVLAAETAADDVRSNFRIDQEALVAAVGAVSMRVRSAQSAVADAGDAFFAARDRRTVVLNLPLDVQAAADPEPSRGAPAILTSGESRAMLRSGTPSPTVRRLIELLASAERPVFIAGRGARHAGPELRELAAASGALLATSAVAHGLFHGDPFALGISGGFASDLTAELISNADLVVGWGCALNNWTTRHGRLLDRNSVLVQVDVDVEAIGAHRPVGLGVQGDVAPVAAAVLAGWGEPRPGYRTADVEKAIAERSRWRDVAHEELPGPGIDPRTLSVHLDDILPKDRTVAVDSGNFMGYPSAYLSVPDQHGFVLTQGFQAIGLGLATAIGAACARPDRLTVAALGDGGALMGAAELETVVRLGLQMVIVVYDDRGYGAEVHHFTDADLATVRFPDTDIAAIGRGFGCEAVTVRSAADLAAVGDWVAGPRAAPLLVDAKIASDGGSWWLAEAFRSHGR